MLMLETNLELVFWPDFFGVNVDTFIPGPKLVEESLRDSGDAPSKSDSNRNLSL